MIEKILEINNKWKKKYNRLCIQYEGLANKKINELEKANEILLQNIQYKQEIEDLQKEIMRYRRKYGRFVGGDKNDQIKNKR